MNKFRELRTEESDFLCLFALLSLFHLTSPATGYLLSTSIEYALRYEAVGNACSVTHNMT